MRRYIIIYSNGSVLDSYPLNESEADFIARVSADKDVTKILDYHGEEVYAKES